MRGKGRAAYRAAIVSGLLTAAAARPADLVAQEHAEHVHHVQAAADSVQRPLASARHEHGEAAAPAPMIAPMASGTSLVPSSSAVRGAHAMAGQWMLMLHGVAYGQYTHQEGRRGGWQFGSINWLMLSATHPTAGGRVELRAMGSAEPYTLGGVGYPLLLQTGETYANVPLHDRQHPHDLAM